jgi:hypothetical protein
MAMASRSPYARASPPPAAPRASRTTSGHTQRAPRGVAGKSDDTAEKLGDKCQGRRASRISTKCREIEPFEPRTFSRGIKTFP